MSTTYKHEHGDLVLTITVVGWHDILRLTWNHLHAQCEFSADARKTFQWMRRALGAKQFDAIDRQLSGGKVRPYSIRPKRQDY